MIQHRHTIRNIDPELIKEARIYAIESECCLGDIINAALGHFLHHQEDVSDTTAFESLGGWSGLAMSAS